MHIFYTLYYLNVHPDFICMGHHYLSKQRSDYCFYHLFNQILTSKLLINQILTLSLYFINFLICFINVSNLQTNMSIRVYLLNRFT